MRLRKKKFRSVEDKGTFKDAHKKLLEHYQDNFPSWESPPMTGVLGAFFHESLDKMSDEGYLEENTVIHKRKDGKRNVQYPVKSYRLSMKGFDLLTELRTKRWFIGSVIIAFLALAISILSLAF